MQLLLHCRLEFHETFVNVLRMQCVDLHITRNFGFYYFFLLIHSRNVIKVYRFVKKLYQFYSNFDLRLFPVYGLCARVSLNMLNNDVCFIECYGGDHIDSSVSPGSRQRTRGHCVLLHGGKGLRI